MFWPLKDFGQYSLFHSVPKPYLHLQEKKKYVKVDIFYVGNQDAANGKKKCVKNVFLH